MPSVSDFKLTSNSAKVGLLASTAAAPITIAAGSTSPATAPSSNGKGNGHRHRRRSQIHRGWRRAAQKGFTAVLFVTEHGMSVTEAIDRADTTYEYYAAMRIIWESGDRTFLNAVLKGVEPVLATAAKVKNAVAVISAYPKSSGFERALIHAHIKLTDDPVTLLLGLTDDQLAAAGRELGNEFVWTKMIVAAMPASEPVTNMVGTESAAPATELVI